VGPHGPIYTLDKTHTAKDKRLDVTPNLIRRYLHAHRIASSTRHDTRKVKKLVVRLLPGDDEHERHEQSNGNQTRDYTEPAHVSSKS
jgi:hypothetical protein